jgi:hypothetical protein
MTTHAQLYEALKPHVGADAARMIADVVPPASNLATKEDIHALRADIFRWGLAAVIPVWVAVWGTLVAAVVQIARG